MARGEVKWQSCGSNPGGQAPESILSLLQWRPQGSLGHMVSPVEQLDFLSDTAVHWGK